MINKSEKTAERDHGGPDAVAFPAGEAYSALFTGAFDVSAARRYDNKFRNSIKAYKHHIQTLVCEEWVRPGRCLDAPIGSGRITKALRARPDVDVVGFDRSRGFPNS